MKKTLFSIIAVTAMLLMPASLMAKREMVGKEYFLQCNIWFEKPMRISSVNYHRGSILKAGTKVRIVRMTGSAIDFVTLSDDLKYRIVYSSKHYPRIKVEEYASWYFGSSDPLKGEAYAGFSEIEKLGVSDGTVKKGMSREAVLMAYGHPPRHRTRSTDLNAWSYWNNKFFRMEVRFGDDGRVNEIIGGGH